MYESCSGHECSAVKFFNLLSIMSFYDSEALRCTKFQSKKRFTLAEISSELAQKRDSLITACRRRRSRRIQKKRHRRSERRSIWKINRRRKGRRNIMNGEENNIFFPASLLRVVCSVVSEDQQAEALLFPLIKFKSNPLTRHEN
jgi:hypothetical protein